MQDRPAGTGKFPVNLQCGFMGTEADCRIGFSFLRKMHDKFRIGILGRHGPDRKLHIDHAPGDSFQTDLFRTDMHIVIFRFVPAQSIKLSGRPLVQAAVANVQFPRKAHLPGPRRFRFPDRAGIPVLHPSDHNPPAVR